MVEANTTLQFGVPVEFVAPPQQGLKTFRFEVQDSSQIVTIECWTVSGAANTLLFADIDNDQVSMQQCTFKSIRNAQRNKITVFPSDKKFRIGVWHIAIKANRKLQTECRFGVQVTYSTPAPVVDLSSSETFTV